MTALTRRRLLLALAGVAGSLPLVSFAQPPSRLRRIGVLTPRSRPDTFYAAFVQGLRELGHVEGPNLLIEQRYAGGDYARLPAFAAELVALPVEVVVTYGNAATTALQRATRTIPIVTAAAGDPVRSGFAASLARPGGNVTGLSAIIADLTPKQLELLSALVPRLSLVAILAKPGNPGHAAIVKSVQATAKGRHMRVLPLEVRTPDDIDLAFAAMVREQAGAAVITGDAFFSGQGPRIAAAALKSRMPTIGIYRDHVVAGTLMSYGLDLADFHRRAAAYVDKILKGAKPGDLPCEEPTTMRFAINRATANALGLPVPAELLLRAHDVIG